jgi:hypothetical protein
MIVIKLAFYSLLFLFLVTAIAGPWVALAAFIALVVYGICGARQNRDPRPITGQEEGVSRDREMVELMIEQWGGLVEHEQLRLQKIAARLEAEARMTHRIDDSAINGLCNPN